VGRRAGPYCTSLLARYSAQERYYHNTAHIVDCLRQLEAFEKASKVTVQDHVRLAVFYHDAIYDPRRHDNEAQSASLARKELAPFVDPGSLDAIGDLIQATDHKQPPANGVAAQIVDADLSILGTSPELFDRYEAAIRAEYSWVPEEKFRAGRAAVLKHFLAREQIYTTHWFHEQYEGITRVNLSRSLAALGEL
jgi:predicted metal-dependent HD superfamily phosphohydrolase